MVPGASTPNPRRRAPLFDVHPQTGVTIEVFYADRTLETFGRGGAGWFWWVRLRGSSPNGPATCPFATSYAAYRDGMKSSELAVSFRMSAIETKLRSKNNSSSKNCAPSASTLLPRPNAMEAPSEIGSKSEDDGAPEEIPTPDP